MVSHLLRASCIAAVCPLMATSPDSSSAYFAEWTIGSGGNGHHYEFRRPPSGILWTDARDASAASTHLGTAGHLVTVSSAEEWTFITDAFPENHVWIGFTDAGHEGTFTWITGEPVTFTA